MRFKIAYLLVLFVILLSTYFLVQSTHLSVPKMVESDGMFPRHSWQHRRPKKPFILKNDLSSQQSSGLKSLQSKVKDGRQLTLVAIGGSNTAGGGLRMTEKRYFEIVADWWNKSTRSKLDAYNMAITGTGSDFFAFCFQNVLPKQKNPDIVMLEFAINDSGDEFGKAAQPMEVLTRRLLSLPSKPLVIYVNLVNPEMRQGRILNRQCGNMQNMGFDILAKHYGIPSFSMKDIVCPLTNGKRVLDESMSRMFASDGSHTSSIGHNKIATKIIKYFQNHLKLLKKNGENLDEASSLIKPLFSDQSINDGQLTNPLCWSQATSNWKVPLKQTLDVKVIKSHGFKYRSPSDSQWEGTSRTDAVAGWMAKPGPIELTAHVNIPKNASARSVGVIFQIRDKPFSIEISLNDEKHSCIRMAIKEGSDSPAAQIRLFPVATEVSPGTYTFRIKGNVKWLYMVGIFAGYRGYHGYKGYKTFEGSITKC